MLRMNLNIRKNTKNSSRKISTPYLIIIILLIVVLGGRALYHCLTMSASSIATTDWDVPVTVRLDTERKWYQPYDGNEKEMPYILTVKKKGIFKHVIYQTSFIFKNNGEYMCIDDVDFEHVDDDHAILTINSDYMDEIIFEIPYK